MADDLIRKEMGMRPASSVRRVFIILICIAVISSVGVPVSASSETDGYSAKKGTIEIGMMAGFWQATIWN